MSEVKRYRLDPESFAAEHPQGDFVDYQDYARLKGEVERLRQEVEDADRESMSDEYDLNIQSRIINGLLTDKEQMQGKIDRLTKAGDLLAFHYISLGRKFFPDDPLPSSITNWNAAKEGKPSV